MITKRYQVFISSTFADLKDERGKVQQAIMELDCIPAGMELFPAIDQDQFEFIKKVIDDCDYYLLIIGGRYGSLSTEGVSYTELEYKYAVDKGKKVIAFLHKDPDSIPAGKSEKDTKALRKLADFRDEVSNGRLVRYWTQADELPGLTLSSLVQAIRLFPAVGWVRGDQVADPGLYKELADLRKENQQLREANTTQNKAPSAIYNLAGLDEEVDLSGWVKSGSQSSYVTQEWSVNISWGDLFSLFGPDLYASRQDMHMSSRIAGKLINRAGLHIEKIYELGLTPTSFNIVKVQYKALGFIHLANKVSGLTWSLTELGEQELFNLSAVKKATPPTQA